MSCYMQNVSAGVGGSGNRNRNLSADNWGSYQNPLTDHRIKQKSSRKDASNSPHNAKPAKILQSDSSNQVV